MSRSRSSSRCAATRSACFSGSAGSEPFKGHWSLPGGLPRAGRDARGIDPPPPRGQGRRARALAPRAARDAQRPRPVTARVAARNGVPRARPERPRSCPAGRHALARGRRPAGGRLRPRARSSLAGRERLRAKLSYTNLGFALAPDEFTISELRGLYAAALGHDVSATNLQRVLLRRNVLEPTGRQRSSGPTGGRPGSLFRFRTQELEITDQFAVLRPPGPARLPVA